MLAKGTIFQTTSLMSHPASEEGANGRLKLKCDGMHGQCMMLYACEGQAHSHELEVPCSSAQAKFQAKLEVHKYSYVSLSSGQSG